MKANISLQYQTFIMDAKTGRPLKISPKKKNLVLDTALNSMARSSAINASYPAQSFAVCKIGSGTNANRFPSGAITFTQVTTTITASAGFFTAAMVGGIFKYGASGTGGNEVYITGFTSSTIVTVDTSLTVATPTAGVVWMVQQTTLQTQSFETSTYQTLAGDCQTTYVSNSMVMKRTFTFPVQVSPYTVNEIGWCSIVGASIFGRAVLTSSDVVGPTNFYVVVMTMTLTIAPGAPVANVNFGTGINTAGTTMIEQFSYSLVNTSGVSAAGVSPLGRTMDGSLPSAATIEFWGTVYTQNSVIASSGNNPPLPATRFNTGANTPSWVYASLLGQMTLTLTLSMTTAGQTIYGMGWHTGLTPFPIAFDCLFTTPQTLPAGSFTPTVIVKSIYSRTLDNT